MVVSTRRDLWNDKMNRYKELLNRSKLPDCSQPLATSQGLRVASMNLSGGQDNFNTSKTKQKNYQLTLLEQLLELMAGIHVVVLTQLHGCRYEWVRDVLAVSVILYVVQFRNL